VVDFDPCVHRLAEIAALADLDGVELLGTEGLDAGGLGPRAQTRLERVLLPPHDRQDLYLLLGLPVLALVLSLGGIALQQPSLHE
jgi:hypothetical protein